MQSEAQRKTKVPLVFRLGVFLLLAFLFLFFLFLLHFEPVSLCRAVANWSSWGLVCICMARWMTSAESRHSGGEENQSEARLLIVSLHEMCRTAPEYVVCWCFRGPQTPLTWADSRAVLWIQFFISLFLVWIVPLCVSCLTWFGLCCSGFLYWQIRGWAPTEMPNLGELALTHTHRRTHTGRVSHFYYISCLLSQSYIFSYESASYCCCFVFFNKFLLIFNCLKLNDNSK